MWKMKKLSNSTHLFIYSFILTFFNWSLFPLPYLIIGTGEKVRTKVLLWMAFYVHNQVTY